MYRIDHVLGFYRIYAFPWMPSRNAEFLPLSADEAAARCGGRRPGFRPRPDDTEDNRRANLMQGDELLASLVQATPGVRVIGEDLGCVPDYVRPDLSRLRTYATHDFPPLSVDWEEWYARVQAGRAAVLDEKLSENELRETLRIARDCGATLCRLGDYAGLTKEESLVAWGPGVKDALYRALMRCRSDYTVMLWTELFDVPVRLNLPGTQGGNNWRPRMTFTAGEAAKMPQSKWIRDIAAEAKRISGLDIK